MSRGERGAPAAGGVQSAQVAQASDKELEERHATHAGGRSRDYLNPRLRAP
jgi:hypothetical protein